MVDEPICKGRNRDRTDTWTLREGEGGTNWEIGTDLYTLLCVKQIAKTDISQIGTDLHTLPCVKQIA